jgi:hypothetical protein
MISSRPGSLHPSGQARWQQRHLTEQAQLHDLFRVRAELLLGMRASVAPAACRGSLMSAIVRAGGPTALWVRHSPANPLDSEGDTVEQLMSRAEYSGMSGMSVPISKGSGY